MFNNNSSYILCDISNKINIKQLYLFFIKTCLFFSIAFLSACGGGNESSSETSVVTPPVVPPTMPAETPKIVHFSFLQANNPELSQDIQLIIHDFEITGRIKNNTAVNNLIATFEYEGNEILINDATQINNTSTNDFTDIVTYTVKNSDGVEKDFQVNVIKFTGLPIINLSTENNIEITSKDDYVKGSVSLDGGRGFDNLTNIEMKIRGRGNSTWGHPKKPFQMKLSDKIEFLSMPKDKKWLFLAEYSDKTMLRNTIAFEMGYISRLDWTPASTFAEVYINDSYNGTYNITQKVEESDNRVALGESGYLLEIDQLERLDDDDVYFRTNDFLINIKAPDLEKNSTEYYLIKNLINNFENNLNSTQFSDPENGYAKYIDIDSFVDWYLISEITKNVDSQFFSSIYFNVIPGEKIKMGPLWDFDLSFGNVDYADSRYSEGYWVKNNPWYSRLFQDPAFVSKVKARFTYFKNNQNYILDKINQYAEKLQFAQAENDNKWQTIGMYVWPNPVVYNTYDEEVSHLKNWYTERMAWLEAALNEL